jgi:hypothetical protein
VAYACDDGDRFRSAGRRAALPVRETTLVKNARGKLPLMASLVGGVRLSEFADGPKATDADPGAAPAAAPERQQSQPGTADDEIHTFRVRDNVYMLLGDGANIVVQGGDQGAFVIDTGAGKLSDKVIRAIKALTPKPIQFVANTSFHGDHVGGNVKVVEAGADLSLPGSFFGGPAANLGAVTGLVTRIGETATLIAHNNVAVRMQGAKAAAAATPSMRSRRSDAEVLQR